MTLPTASASAVATRWTWFVKHGREGSQRTERAAMSSQTGETPPRRRPKRSRES